MPSAGLLTVDLNALVGNWAYLRDYLGGRAECAAVVKANAYGLGVAPVASALKRAGCQQFFVATLPEAIELREILGSEVSIVVFGGLAHGLSSDWVRMNLIPALFDISHIQQWVSYCESYGMQLPCALKVDSGMHRFGIDPELLMHFFQDSERVHSIAPVLLMSHLSCADDVSHSMNQRQLDCFRQISKRAKELYPDIKSSLSNSSGIFLGNDFHFDVCRPGCALYGVNPTPHKKNPMRSVVKLSLPIMQLRTIAAGESVGYGAAFTASTDMRLATVFGGYADGLLRTMSNKAYGWCDGVKVPLVGRVSMDSMVFDVTAVSGDPLAVEVLNESQGVDELAAYANTIGYEILTGLGSRYQRQYEFTDDES